MSTRTDLTDREALLAHRRRAQAMAQPALFLHEIARDEIEERLKLVKRSFTAPALITPFPKIFGDHGARHVGDEEILTLTPQDHDLVIHAMALHWANDPVGQLVQCRRALRPDGLFLGVAFGGQTLVELRSALAEAETRLTGGLSPRVAPMAEIRDLGGLMQRAGFALPVADSLTQTVRYRTLKRLLHDLRAMGETNALAGRRKHTPSALFTETETVYRQHFGQDGYLLATFELVFLTGWAPDESQPKPLRPGSATTRLADALGTAETSAGDAVLPPNLPSGD